MRYKLTLQKDSDIKEVIYDSRKNSFYNLQFTKNDDNKYSNNSLLINIYMGGKCNYKCKYCIQSDTMKSIDMYDIKDIKIFIENFINYINKHFSNCDYYKVLVWGGEPLVYFNTMKNIHNGLMKCWGEDKFSFGFCTNGSLINKEVFNWIKEYKNISFTLSYDGPGQHLRNEKDVLDTNKELLEYLKTTENWSVNPVWTKANNNITNFIEYINEKVGHTNWRIGDNTQHLIVMDNKILDYCLSEQELQDFTIDVCRHIHFQNETILHNYYNQAKRFINHLNNPSRCYKCTNSSKDAQSLNVDLSGNIWACHSCVGKQEDCLGGNLYIGTLNSERNPVEYKFLDYKYKRKCVDCVMRMICCGGCPLTDKEYDDYNCINNWYKAYPTLFVAMNMLTNGYQLLSIEKI